MSVPGRSSANLALLLLLGINLFNYVDRQILAALEPEIRKSLFGETEDSGTKFWMGLLSTAFLISYMVCAPLFSALADRYSRWMLIGLGVLIWSLASGGSGVPWTSTILSAYTLLLLTRCFVGVGEGGYGPVAPSMLADFYPVEKRGKIMSLFYLAISVGGALGYAFGELVKDVFGTQLDQWFGTDFGWRWAFFLVVPPGVLLAFGCFFMRDPARGQSDQDVVPSNRSLLDRYRTVAKIPSFIFNSLGMTGMAFAIGGLAYWMPAYLEAKNVPGLGPLGPRTVFGLITAVAGLTGTIAGGVLGDWLRPRFSGSYFLVSGLAMLLGVPCLVIFMHTPFPYAWAWGFLAVFGLFVNMGPTNTILANVTHPSLRTTGFALNILIIRLLGDALSPPLMGAVAGQFADQRAGLDAAFYMVNVVMVLGGVFWLLGTKHLANDTELAPKRG